MKDLCGCACSVGIALLQQNANMTYRQPSMEKIHHCVPSPHIRRQSLYGLRHKHASIPSGNQFINTWLSKHNFDYFIRIGH
jgi:hypothetical protein